MSDLALARRLLAGDEAGFEVFFAIYFPRIYRFALSRLGPEDAAEEVGQAVLIAAVRALHTYRGDPAIFAWLCVLCRREEFAWAERTGRATDGARVDDQFLAGAVADDRTARVREAVLQAWRTAIRDRQQRIQRNALVVVAVLALAAGIVFAGRFKTPDATVPAPPAPVAVVDRVDGRFRLEPGEGVPAGEWVQTQPGTHASLRLGDRTSIRLDSASRARLISATAVELSEGAVYVDTGRESSAGLEVRTPLGIAHAVGTQFEVRLRDGSLQVRVRSGTVELRRGAESTAVPAAAQLTVTEGRTVSAAIKPFGPEWEWASSVAPAFSIEGRPLAAFLDHLSREHGWTVRYADAALAAQASTLLLRGSVDGLSPHDALTVVIATSGLSHRLENGRILVERKAGR